MSFSGDVWRIYLQNICGCLCNPLCKDNESKEMLTHTWVELVHPPDAVRVARNFHVEVQQITHICSQWKCYEYNIEMHVLFIDFKQAWLCWHKKTVQILQELRIPNKLIWLIKMTLQNMEASVKIENLTSKPFSISSGVRQGDPLSATLI
jgi:hypothetical protein